MRQRLASSLFGKPPKNGLRICPAAVGEDFLAGDGGAGVAGEEEEDVGDLVGLDEGGQALGAADEAFDGGSDVIAELTLSHNPAGRDGVDTDAERAEFASEGAREAEDTALGRDVGGHLGGRDVKGDGGEIDDGCAG